MFRRIFFYCLILNFVPFTNVNSAESGGMPQLNPEYWISQIFWLTLSFGFLFVILSKFILPKISNNLELRKSQILDNIETAEKQKKESENKIKEYESLILNSKNEAKNYFNDARKKIQQDINKKREKLENEIDEEINKIEKEIENIKSNFDNRKKDEDTRRMTRDNIRKQFIEFLIGGDTKNSTLKNRLESTGSRIRAKTGHLSGVSCLSGYAFSPHYGPVAFSMLMNGYIGSSREYRQLQDQILGLLIHD